MKLRSWKMRDADNLGSRRVLEKAGFTLEDTL